MTRGTEHVTFGRYQVTTYMETNGIMYCAEGLAFYLETGGKVLLAIKVSETKSIGAVQVC